MSEVVFVEWFVFVESTSAAEHLPMTARTSSQVAARVVMSARWSSAVTTASPGVVGWKRIHDIAAVEFCDGARHGRCHLLVTPRANSHGCQLPSWWMATRGR